MSRRPAARPDLTQLAGPVRVYIESLESRLARTRADNRRLLDQLHDAELKNEAYQRVLDAAALPAPTLPFTPESSAYVQRCPHCDHAFDRRGFATHEQACARRHGAAPTTTPKRSRP